MANMFKKIVNSIYNFADKVENKFNTLTDYFDNKIYNFTNRKQLAKKAAIKAKVKELADKFGLPLSTNECNLAITKDTNAQWLINLCYNSDSNRGYVGYYISCPSDYGVSKCRFTDYKYDVVVVDWKYFYEIDESIDKHIQKLLKQYKECVTVAKIKQIEFDFTENKKPIFDELCKLYNIDYFSNPTNYSILGDSIIKQFSILYDYETNMIYFPNGFIENDTNLKNNSFKDVYFDTLEEYRDFIESHLEFFKKQLNEYIKRI